MKLEFKNFIYLDENEKISILEIRNSKYVREKMSSDGIIEKEAHFNWIENLKNNQNSKYFAIVLDNIVIGSVYFTINEKKECFWGIYIKESSSAIIIVVSAYLFIDFIIYKNCFQEVFALVKNINQNAIKFNKNFGFEILKEDKEYIYLKLSKEIWEKEKNSKLIKPIKRYLDKIEYNFKD